MRLPVGKSAGVFSFKAHFPDDDDVCVGIVYPKYARSIFLPVPSFLAVPSSLQVLTDQAQTGLRPMRRGGCWPVIL